MQSIGGYTIKLIVESHFIKIHKMVAWPHEVDKVIVPLNHIPPPTKMIFIA
jgi:hypothetical protein